MPKPSDIYVHCDELEKIPEINRRNWEWELRFLTKELPTSASVLQVGCMDGTRIVALLKERPDLRITGLDIDETLLEKAKGKFTEAGMNVQTVLCDITSSSARSLSHSDYVICLNNTLGYISDDVTAIENMKTIGDTVIVSVYGENFTDDRAHEYFASLGLSVDTIDGDAFHISDFGIVKLFPRKEVKKWGGRIEETPLGYCCTIMHA